VLVFVSPRLLDAVRPIYADCSVAPEIVVN
jgi:hypothetical protein